MATAAVVVAKAMIDENRTRPDGTLAPMTRAQKVWARATSPKMAISTISVAGNGEVVERSGHKGLGTIWHDRGNKRRRKWRSGGTEA